MSDKRTDPADGAQEPPYDRPSKSQVKRDMLALLALGKDLVELPNERLKQLPLEEPLYDAIRQAQRTQTREGRRRQIHYVGKLMRTAPRSEEQTSELQSLMRISYAVFCLKKKNTRREQTMTTISQKRNNQN